MHRQRIQELGPFGGAACVGHVPGDEDRIQRVRRVERLELREQPLEPCVAARTRSSALDAKPVTLADDVEIGQMRHPPLAAGLKASLESVIIAGLRHGRVGEGPHQRAHGEINRNQNDAVGQNRR